MNSTNKMKLYHYAQHSIINLIFIFLKLNNKYSKVKDKYKRFLIITNKKFKILCTIVN